MASKLTTYPSLFFPYNNNLSSTSGYNYVIYMPDGNIRSWNICSTSNSSLPQYALMPGYCGGRNDSWFNYQTFSDYYGLPYDSSLTGDFFYPVVLDDSGDFYYVDWLNPVSTSSYWYYGSTNMNFNISNHPVVSGGVFEYTEGSGGSSGEVVPSDDPYAGVINAIHTASAVPIVLCFFFVIYKMFMRLRG